MGAAAAGDSHVDAHGVGAGVVPIQGIVGDKGVHGLRMHEGLRVHELLERREVLLCKCR